MSSLLHRTLKYHQNEQDFENQRQTKIRDDVFSKFDDVNFIKEINTNLKISADKGNYAMEFHKIKHVMDDYFYPADDAALKKKYYDLIRENTDALFQCRALKKFCQYSNRYGVFDARLVYDETIARPSMVDSNHVQCSAVFKWDLKNSLLHKLGC